MRATNRLTALRVERLKTPGLHPDGGGLYLRIAKGGTKGWVYRYMLSGRARAMGLGSSTTCSLAEARQRAAEARRARQGGVDPIGARIDERTKARLQEARGITFEACAAAYVQAHRAGWRSSKHAGQWTQSIATYATPIIGALPVQGVDMALLMRVLEQPIGLPPVPLWTARPETASRLRGRIEAILDWARVRGYRSGENPARWRGHLDHLLPRRSKVRGVEHFAAMSYAELPSFMTALRGETGMAARALEFAVLMAARTGEVLGATWTEIDWQTRTWTIPAGRMKSGKGHRVPLCARAIEILKELQPLTSAVGKFLFAGSRLGKPLSPMAMPRVLLALGRSDTTVHGFRSAFRDWAAEKTDHSGDVIEMALAHAVGNKVARAYQRSDLFEKRRRLMDDWGEFCAGAAARVIALPGRRR
jgi:integrase